MTATGSAAAARFAELVGTTEHPHGSNHVPGIVPCTHPLGRIPSGVPEGFKHCNSCRSCKPLTNFFISKSGPTAGRPQAGCKSCRAGKSVAWYRSNRESVNERVKEHRRRTGYRRQRMLKINYGLTPERYEEMFRAQKGLCAICHSRPIEWHGRLVVDHDHATGQVRDLLCARCNTAIGQFRDDPSIIAAALTYLIRHSATGAVSL